MNKRIILSGAIVAALGCSFAAPVSAAGETVAAMKTKVLAGQAFTFTKYVDEDGGVRGEIRDAGGRPVAESALPKVATALLDARVSSWLEQTERAGLPGETLTVDIALNLPVPAQQEPIEVGEAHVREGRTQGAINGRSMAHEEMNAYADSVAREQRAEDAAQAGARVQALSAWAARQGLGGAQGLEDSLARGGESATLALTPAQIRALAAAQDPAIAGIEPHAAGEDDINQAMAATNITSWALPYAATRGGDIGIYMTENGCPDPSRFSGTYKRLAGTEDDHSRNVGAIIRAVSPYAYLYCRSDGDAVLPLLSDLDGFAIHIVNRSSSIKSDTGTYYGTLDRDWDNFAYDHRIAIFNSGGNTGTGIGNVRSPGKGLNVITVGNYDDATNSVHIASPFKDPTTGNAKPEVVAPGTGITAGGFTMTGTSQATPHAAAFTADLMSQTTAMKYRPYLAKARLLAGATDLISGGADKVGLGGIDFLSAGWNGYWSWWQGENDWWSTFDTQDGSTDGYVSHTVYLSSWNKVRVALAWMTRGSYTYDHRNDAHAIGLDLDLSVYGPDGSRIGGSASWDNPFETVEFTPVTSGNYTFKITRFANRDSAAKLRMGLYVNYYD